MPELYKYQNGELADADEVNADISVILANQMKSAMYNSVPVGSLTNYYTYPLDYTDTDENKNGVFCGSNKAYFTYNWDNFEDGSIDSTKWSTVTADSSGLAEAGGSFGVYKTSNSGNGVGSTWTWIGSGTAGYNFFNTSGSNTEIYIRANMLAQDYHNGGGTNHRGSAVVQISNGSTHVTVYRVGVDSTPGAALYSAAFSGMIIIHLDKVGSTAYVSVDGAGGSWSSYSLSTVTGSWFLRGATYHNGVNYNTIDYWNLWHDVGFINPSVTGSIGSFTTGSLAFGSAAVTAIATTLGSANGSTFSTAVSFDNGTTYTNGTFDALTRSTTYGSRFKLKVSGTINNGSVVLGSKPCAPYVRRIGVTYG